MGADEDVRAPVRVPADEVARKTPERHVATVAGDRGEGTVEVPFRSVRANAHPLGRAEQAGADEDVLEVVRVSADEVVGAAPERHVATVSGDRGPEAFVVAFHSTR